MDVAAGSSFFCCDGDPYAALVPAVFITFQGESVYLLFFKVPGGFCQIVFFVPADEAELFLEGVLPVCQNIMTIRRSFEKIVGDKMEASAEILAKKNIFDAVIIRIRFDPYPRSVVGGCDGQHMFFDRCIRFG